MPPQTNALNDSPLASLLKQLSAQVVGEPSQPRWGLVRRARRDIELGLHDNQACVQVRLDACMDEILADILP